MASKLLSSTHVKKDFFWEQAHEGDILEGWKNHFYFVIFGISGKSRFGKNYIEIDFFLYGDNHLVTKNYEVGTLAVQLLDIKILNERGQKIMNGFLTRQALKHKKVKYPNTKLVKNETKIFKNPKGAGRYIMSFLLKK